MTSDQNLVLEMFQQVFEKKPVEALAASEILPLACSIPRGNVFSSFFRSHRLAAKELCNYLMECQTVAELKEKAERVHGELNEKLYIYVISYVILSKKEMRSVRLPTLVEVLPSCFVPWAVLSDAEQRARQSSSPSHDTITVECGPESFCSPTKPEHSLAYWREDYGINLHHWHWHLVYPNDMGVKRDRKGELFYYMHQQMLSRYDMDRLSVGLSQVEELANWRIPIPDGYFPKLNLNNSGQNWGSRPDDTLLKDYRRSDLDLDPFDIADLEQSHKRIMDAIHQGSLVDHEGNRVKLTDECAPPSKRGIDLLGDVIEADNTLSLNYDFYGDLHNLGHVLISAAHDPDHTRGEFHGVMSDNTTAMRDPAFYRWHKYVDNLYQAYKVMQSPYSPDELSLQSVAVEEVEVECEGHKNLLTTGWNKRDFEASRGLDFKAKNPVKVCMTHLDHLPFRYNIKVENNETSPKEVTIRIFMAPKFNERGVQMNYMEQRLLWAEMDRFTYTLKPGSNSVIRESIASSITNPNEFTFQNLVRREIPEKPEHPQNDLFNFCGCGWPQHMLLPRGKEEGMDFQLFVMVTDWAQDKVEQPAGRRRCANASSFCGVLDSLYPDARPMGFPFDRRPGRKFNSTTDDPMQRTEELAELSNVAMQDIKIVFTNGPLKQ